MATYLITGIAGFIGSSLARAVLAQGDNVRGVDNFSTGKRNNIAELLDRIDVREADLLDLEAMQSACQGVDYVLHEAAIPSVPRSVLNPSGEQSSQCRRNRQCAGRGSRCKSETRDLRGFVFGVRRYAHACPSAKI